MVDYSARPRPRKYRDPEEVARRRAERAAARTPEDWRKFARDLCYRQLGMMERSVQQLRVVLERNDVPADIATETLDAFIEADLVNDERFAGMFVRSKFAQKATSRRVIARELQRKGINQEIAQEALAQISEEDELAAAIDFAQRRARTMANLAPEVARRRLYGALARRGYNPDQVRQALNAAGIC